MAALLRELGLPQPPPQPAPPAGGVATQPATPHFHAPQPGTGPSPAPTAPPLGAEGGMSAAELSAVLSAVEAAFPTHPSDDDEYLTVAACYCLATRRDPRALLPPHSLHLADLAAHLRGCAVADGRLAALLQRFAAAATSGAAAAVGLAARLGELLAAPRARLIFRQSESLSRKGERVVSLALDQLLRAAQAPNGNISSNNSGGTKLPVDAWQRSATLGAAAAAAAAAASGPLGPYGAGNSDSLPSFLFEYESGSGAAADGRQAPAGPGDAGSAGPVVSRSASSGGAPSLPTPQQSVQLQHSWSDNNRGGGAANLHSAGSMPVPLPAGGNANGANSNGTGSASIAQAAAAALARRNTEPHSDALSSITAGSGAGLGFGSSWSGGGVGGGAEGVSPSSSFNGGGPRCVRFVRDMCLSARTSKACMGFCDLCALAAGPSCTLALAPVAVLSPRLVNLTHPHRFPQLFNRSSSGYTSANNNGGTANNNEALFQQALAVAAAGGNAAAAVMASQLAAAARDGMAASPGGPASDLMVPPEIADVWSNSAANATGAGDMARRPSLTAAGLDGAGGGVFAMSPTNEVSVDNLGICAQYGSNECLRLQRLLVLQQVALLVMRSVGSVVPRIAALLPMQSYLWERMARQQQQQQLAASQPAGAGGPGSSLASANAGLGYSLSGLGYSSSPAANGFGGPGLMVGSAPMHHHQHHHQHHQQQGLQQAFMPNGLSNGFNSLGGLVDYSSWHSSSPDLGSSFGRRPTVAEENAAAANAWMVAHGNAAAAAAAANAAAAAQGGSNAASRLIAAAAGAGGEPAPSVSEESEEVASVGNGPLELDSMALTLEVSQNMNFNNEYRLDCAL